MSAVGLAGGDAALLFGSRNQIDFVVDNETDYELKAESTVFADWGDFSRYPSTVHPLSEGCGGHVMSSHSPFTGSAGMVGYKISTSSGSLWLRFLGSNPYLSVRSNWAYVDIFTWDKSIDQDSYNDLYNKE
ncbi:hypothetical protein SAPIO_CDS4819 [Scedosporium apiospermum]|uniref:Uncharacterized protein n=1 Tax=Pseudallescheria apiosperma TaxID=563466 RepID=A0A084G7P7_PSEDA|nr:uncharacterized protein SAPIO_CDS4819 [Scedosporium apiospermum]KEZ43359.1 hypothetical protein SAPIO_CDS4819 [Scedosporium apiospermum]